MRLAGAPGSESRSPGVSNGMARAARPAFTRWIQHGRRLAFWATVMVFLATGSARAADRVYPRPEAVEPLAIGTPVPSVQVKTVRGEPVNLREAMGDRGALLVFYRGGW